MGKFIMTYECTDDNNELLSSRRTFTTEEFFEIKRNQPDIFINEAYKLFQEVLHILEEQEWRD